MSHGESRPVPISIRTRGLRADRDAIRRLVRRCLDAEGAPAGRGAGIVLAGDQLVRKLNREWRGLDRTTDVLSFPLEQGPPLPPGVEEEREDALIGEVIVSMPVCRAQAGEAGTGEGVELVRLLIHGLMHLMGHDHEDPEEARRMRGRERALRNWAAGQGIGPDLVGSRDAGGGRT